MTQNTTTTTTNTISMGGYRGEGKAWAAIDKNGAPIPGSIVYMNDHAESDDFGSYRKTAKALISEKFNRPVGSFRLSCWEAIDYDGNVYSLQALGF